MKYLKSISTLFFIFLILSCFSCKPKHEETQTKRINRLQSADTLKNHPENPKIIAYRNFLLRLDNSDINSVLTALNSFRNQFQGSLNNTCDSAYSYFQILVDSIEYYQNLKLDNDTTDYSMIQKNEKIPKRIIEYINQLNINGFRMQFADNYPFIIQDRKFFAEKLDSYISVQMKSFLLYLDNEYKTGFAESDSIIISPQRLVDRILWYEKFNQENPDFIFTTECQNHLKSYITYLVLGYGKSKYFINETNFEISAYFSQANAYLFVKNANSTTSQMLIEIKEALDSKSINRLTQARKNLSIKGIIYNL